MAENKAATVPSYDQLSGETPVSAGMLRDLLRAGMESPEPAATIARMIGERAGKPLTERDAQRLREATGDDRLRLSKQYGMTQIHWGGYGQSGGDSGGCIVLSHATVSVLCPTEAEIIDRNPAYFGAAVERNAQRAAAIDSRAPEQAAELVGILRDAWAELQALTAYGAPLSVLSCDLDRLTGLEPRRHGR